jgi:hypothetical protein
MDYLEKDIEAAFVNWYPSADINYDYPRYLGRQIRTPIGIIDALFWNDRLCYPIIVEVKRKRTQSDVVPQIFAYMNYIERAITFHGPYMFELPHNREIGIPRGIIVAMALDRQTERLVGISDNLDFIQYDYTGTGFTFSPEIIDHASYEYPPKPSGVFKWMGDQVLNRYSVCLLGDISFRIDCPEKDSQLIKQKDMRELGHSVLVWER